ncbi:MAG: M48 family metalloprotease, partial [Candidatus Acidiferrum sp.]
SLLAALFVAGLCVPSYLWLEPYATAERVGVVCAVLGLLGAATWALSITRAMRAVLANLRHQRSCAAAASGTRLHGESSPVLVVEQEAPLLAMSGLLHSRLLISRGVLRTLSADELEAALSHELAHRASRDNAKRLLFFLAPDIFPFVRPLRTLERGWSKFTEWAADDQAAAGDSSRALSLAAALVRVARMGTAPPLPTLTTSLLASDADLSARVNRLLHPSPKAPARTSQRLTLLRIGGVLIAGCLAAFLLAPPALAAVHELLELFLR